MTLEIGEGFPNVKEFLKKCSASLVVMCAKRHDHCSDLVCDPSPDRHFKHVWNELVTVIEQTNEGEIEKKFDTLFYLTQFTPEYTSEYLAYYSEERMKVLVPRLLLFVKHREDCVQHYHGKRDTNKHCSACNPVESLFFCACGTGM